MILGLTGGMGGGKSTAAKFFVELGFQLIDTDRIVREELLTDVAIVAKIGARFPQVVGSDGHIIRLALAREIFENDEARLWLEALLHPLIYEKWRLCLATAPSVNWVIEVPLLFEKKLENWFDHIVCVSTCYANQLARLIERGISQSLAEQRISKQLPLAKKLEKADFILSNDGNIEFLRMQVKHLVERLSCIR